MIHTWFGAKASILGGMADNVVFQFLIFTQLCLHFSSTFYTIHINYIIMFPILSVFYILVIHYNFQTREIIKLKYLREKWQFLFETSARVIVLVADCELPRCRTAVCTAGQRRVLHPLRYKVDFGPIIWVLDHFLTEFGPDFLHADRLWYKLSFKTIKIFAIF